MIEELSPNVPVICHVERASFVTTLCIFVPAAAIAHAIIIRDWSCQSESAIDSDMTRIASASMTPSFAMHRLRTHDQSDA